MKLFKKIKRCHKVRLEKCPLITSLRIIIITQKNWRHQDIVESSWPEKGMTLLPLDINEVKTIDLEVSTTATQVSTFQILVIEDCAM